MPKVLKITIMQCQYLRKELIYEVDVLYADKRERLLKVDNIILDGFGQTCPNSLPL